MLPAEHVRATGKPAGNVAAAPNPAADRAIGSTARTAAGRVLQILGWDPVSYDSLVLKVPELDVDLDRVLLELEIAGQIERLADGRLQRLPD